LRRALAALLALATWSAIARAEPLAFVLPEGFVDRTSDGAAEFQPLLATMGAPHGRVVKLGVDMRGGKPCAAMLATVVDGPDEDIALPSPSDLQYRIRMAAINQGVTLTSIQAARVTIGGVKAVRVIIEGPTESFDSHRELYFVSGERQLGVVSFLASTEEVATYAPRFAAALQKTTGLRAVPWWRFSFAGTATEDIEKLLPLVIVLPIGYFGFLARRGRRRRDAGLKD
jgi:hypothetical protein